jgi:hypothetical protein
MATTVGETAAHAAASIPSRCSLGLAAAPAHIG